ncbi:hypothetical protein [Burkholderia oklahomensis]|uniref:hypothetical protein n=1 Tax=Burkholderia oklahomensis TaxID=342113 RepID=UPI000F536E6F|nr:hypothetical protein [Burkholderia oklahomensis]MBI0360581.1 hypothetical protein [Burkholderia oklahomensis]
MKVLDTAVEALDHAAGSTHRLEKPEIAGGLPPLIAFLVRQGCFDLLPYIVSRQRSNRSVPHTQKNRM